jgi:antitoxin HicB
MPAMENISVFTWSYPLDLEPDDNGTWLITAPDLPELTTWAPIGKLPEAVQYARKALVAALAARMQHGEDIPHPSAAKDRLSVIAPTLVGLKVTLYRAMRAQGISQKELARRLNCDPKEVRRILDVTHSTRANLLDRALLSVEVQPPSSAVRIHAIIRGAANDIEIKRAAMHGAEIHSLLRFARKKKHNV